MRTSTCIVSLAVVLLLACSPASQPLSPTSPPKESRPTESQAPAAKAEQPEELQRLVAAARERGEFELNLSWSENTLGGSQGARKFEALLNRMYGLNVKVNFTPGPSMTDMAAKVTQEVAAGRKASTDVLLGSEGHFSDLVDRGVLEEYDYTKLSSRIRKEFVAPRNIGVEFASRLPGITYNTDLVPPAQAPRTLEDTLSERWRGKIASTINAASLDRVAARPEWGVEKMRSFVTRLSQHVAGLIRCGESSRLVSGEFLMLVMDCGSYEANRQRAKGAPLGHVIPEDAATVVFWYLGVPRNSEHANLAKLFINAVMSEEGQRIVYETDNTDHYALPGSQSAGELSGLRAKGIEPLRVDVKFTLEHPELRGLSDEFTKILREKRGT